MRALLADSTRSALLLLAILLSACQTPLSQLQELAVAHERQVENLPGSPFPLVLATPRHAVPGQRLRVYLEGDGHAWATSSQPSLDPSPRQLLLAELAFTDPTPNLYLARPCQFISAPTCTTALWTNRRYAEEIVHSLDQALDQLKARYDNRDFELVGYSGGATLALLLALRRDDIAQVQTLAGNLSPRRWTATLTLTPLDGSLEPLDQRERLARIPQRHLLGDADRVIPRVLLDDYRRALGQADCLETAILPGVGHAEGWPQAWAAWREQPLSCVP
ncbi:alpha/beta hydrolase [Pseudomonas sp. EA_35y_Pfl2_R111]|uniref:alpha/beta hydrolase n=1 Tax=Pseudomonas sp. EA_35y_Pfl2_R111 TaxID=3088689 RepID=UPI0030DACBF0